MLQARKPSSAEYQRHNQELDLIREALAPAERDGVTLVPRLHSNEAGRRLGRLLETGSALTRADIAQLLGMAEFPEQLLEHDRSRRGAYLSALQHLGLATLEQRLELSTLVDLPAAAYG